MAEDLKMKSNVKERSDAQKQSVKKAVTAIGLEYDHQAVRAVKITGDIRGGFALEAAEELRGDYQKDETLVAALLKLKSKLGIGMGQMLVTHLGGKQVYAAQFPFRKVADEQMTGALKIQLRKSIPFEIAGSNLEYQTITQADQKDAVSQVLVSVASRVILNRHLRVLERAGLTPDIVDIHPLAVGNALQVGGAAKLAEDEIRAITPADEAEGAPGEAAGGPDVALHVGPAVCTVVIDGPGSPFFHRSIYFTTDEVFGSKKDATAPRERERRLNALGDEIARSLTYYQKNNQTAGFGRLCLLGDYVDDADLEAVLRKSTGLPVRRLNTAALSTGAKKELPAGKYDLAIALALRAAPTGTVNSHRYFTNMVREMRGQEKKARARRLFTLSTGIVCFGILALALLFTTLKILTMENILSNERDKLARLESEYRKYQATRLIVDKSDIELLDSLQGTRIFWTKKQAAMAMHLPENYWITEFGFKQRELGVKGYGYISEEQEQLVTLDEYLNLLRNDSTFNDDFRNTYLDVTERDDEYRRQRVEFEYSGVSDRAAGNVSLKRRRR